MRHTKRILSLALALFMMLTCIPATVLAADSTPALPSATVSPIEKEDLTFAMNFAVTPVTEEQLAYYGNWYADFELTINKDATFNNDGTADGWLAGQYDQYSSNWITVPFGKNAPVTVTAGEPVRIMAFAAEQMKEPGLKYTFKEVYEKVKNFDCGIYFDDEYLLANPDLEVNLVLKMYNPANEAESYMVGKSYTYTNPVVAKNTTTGKTYADVADALLDCNDGETVALLKDSSTQVVAIYENATLDLNGYTLVASYVSSFGHVIDSSADNTGVLNVPANRFMIREDNEQLPVFAGNGYQFVEVLRIDTAMASSVKFAFQPRFEPGMLELLKQGGDLTGVSIQVVVSWTQPQGNRTQNFVFKDQLLVDFLNSYNATNDRYGKMFTLTLNGAEALENLSFAAVIVSENGVTFSSDNPRPVKPGNVTTNAQNQVVNDVTIGNGNASALVPSGTQLDNGTVNVTLNATEMEKTTSNITLSGDDQMLSMNVHVDGVSANNTVPIIVTLTELAPEFLNQGNLTLYHVEKGQTIEMTRVYSLAEVDAHNEYYYDIATGTVTMALATFSEIAVRSNTKNVWGGMQNMNTEWYNTTDTSFVIYNADQLAGFGAIVGGMAAGIEQDSFAGKTVTLMADINLGDVEEDGKIFYPIGYYNSEGTYEKSGVPITSGFKLFEGTFNGNGHTISNFYQNTWEMKGDNEYYAASEQRYRDGMGLFGRVYGGTIKNLTVDNFTSDGEYTTTGTIAAYADFGATFENISITNCNPRVYNIGNGGIVGCVGWYTKGVTEQKVTFRNITVDNTNKISALWGSWDVACGGIVGQYYPTSGQTSAGTPANAGIALINCHVAAQIDVYNDVCANYQYYAYRYAGMLIGSVRENVTIDGHSYPKMDGITAEDCTVHYGDWNDYYYCELVANSLASYTHDHQMSRLTQVLSIEGTTITYLDGTTGTVPTSGRYNYVVVKEKDDKGAWIHGDGHEFAECYHFVDGVVWNHEDAGTENVNGETVLKEDKQLVYREFTQLVTGYGWGVTSKGVNDVDGVDILDNEGSFNKFVPLANSSAVFETGSTISVGKLFAAAGNIPKLVAIQNANVQVFVSPADETSTVRGTYTANTDDWTLGTVTLSGSGMATITITDYFYCNPVTIEVNVAKNVTYQWQLVKDLKDLQIGDKIVIVAADYNYALGTTQKNNNRASVQISKGNDTVNINENVQIITVKAGTVDGTYAFYVQGSVDAEDGYLYAAGANSDNYLRTKATLDENGSWSISITEAGIATIKAQNDQDRNWLRYNQTNDLFACYSSGQKDIAIYKQTAVVGCDHAWGEDIVTAPTCTTEGYTTKTCSKCQTSEVVDKVEALGHTYEEVVTAPTCTAGGYTTYTCSVCKDTKIDNKTNPLGHTYVNGACSVCGIAGGTTGTGSYIKVESEAQFTSGKYVLVVSGYAPKVYDSSTKWLTVVQPTISNNTVSGDKGAVVILTVDGDLVKLQDANGAYLAPSGGNTNGIKTGEYSWAWAMDNGTIQFKGTGSDTVILAANKSESYKIRAYKTSTANNETNYPTKFTLYKWVEDGVGGGDSGETECEHNYTSVVTAPTCTEDGYTTYTCTKCNATYQGNKTTAIGHDYQEVVTAPTCITDGHTTHTCANCKDTYTDSETPKTGVHNFGDNGICSTEGCNEVKPVAGVNISFHVSVGAAPAAVVGTTITLPTNVTAPEGYEFVGWATAHIQGASSAEFYQAGTSYTATEDTTLYAVYAKTVVTGGSYVQKALADIKNTDVVVITMKNSSGVYALNSGNGTSSAPAATKVTVSGTALSGDIADALKWNIENDNGNLTIYPNGVTNKWLYCTATNNGVRVGTNANKVFTIDASSGYLKNTATSRYVGVYNSQDWRCYTSTSTNINGQTLAFYVLSTGNEETTYYTCIEHDWQNATCQSAKTCTICGVEEGELGDHNYVNGTCSVCGDEEPTKSWVKVTDVSSLKAGDQIIIVSGTNVAGSLNSSYLNSVAFNAANLSADAMIFTLGGSSGAWTLTAENGKLLGTTAAKALSLGSGTTTWTIAISGGNATVKSTNTSYGWIQYNSGAPRFTTYTSNQTAIQLYKLA